ncbi:metabotropic glutamate receptor [Plakobranchus ocellatus]|uniref:Metabotropic glutamate receptor n=1 Tax=Plakobranchus ocellatus TaxID=259542 RepID=A0AAV4AGZ5_9GAST|nr:metabotropic glutamate receptor [Plakobranchus ocellatus]
MNAFAPCILVLLSGASFFGIFSTAANIIIPQQPPLRYIRHGDIDLGGIISGFDYATDGLCKEQLFMEASYHFSESLVYAIDRINRNSSLLPNVTLGFVILDDCMKQTTAAVQAIAFLPRDTVNNAKSRTDAAAAYDPLNYSTINTCHNNDDLTLRSSDYKTSNSSQVNNSTTNDILTSYNVVGVIGCLRSSNSIEAAHILSAGQVPIISFVSTSEKLSNRQLFPYFFRVIPSDSYVVDAQVELILQMKWRYISVVYAEGDFGETAYQCAFFMDHMLWFESALHAWPTEEQEIKSLRNRLSEIDDICIATSEKIYQKDTYKEHMKIMKNLIKHKEARVVVAFTDPPSAQQFLQASSELGQNGWFIWLVNESWKLYIALDDKDAQQSPVDVIVAGFPTLSSPSYNQYAAEMNPKTNSNPWFHYQWEKTFQCSTSDQICLTNHNATFIPGSDKYVYSDLVYEAVLTYAHALHNLIGRDCPQMSGRDVRNCITGPRLKEVTVF